MSETFQERVDAELAREIERGALTADKVAAARPLLLEGVHPTLGDPVAWLTVDPETVGRVREMVTNHVGLAAHRMTNRSGDVTEPLYRAPAESEVAPICPGCDQPMARCLDPLPGPEVELYPKYRCVPCVRAGRGLYVELQANPNWVKP